MRLGIIGTNFISDRLAHAAGLTYGVEIVAVYSRKRDTGTAFAQKYPSITEVFDDLDTFLSSNIDAVYVASPIVAHAEQTLRALEQGKHVLCEKMMAHTLSAFLDMRRAAERHGRVLLEAMRPAHDPLIDTVRNSLPRIGKIRRASLEFCQYSSRYDKFKAGIVENAFNPKIKNSALSDIGIYPLYLAMSLFGEPESLDSRSVILDNGFEGEGVLTLTYPDKLVSVTYSKIFGGTLPSVIEGECGSIVINKISAPTEITLNLRGKSPEVIGQAETEGNMCYEISAFRDMCEGKLDHKPYLEVTELQQKVVEASYELSGAKNYF